MAATLTRVHGATLGEQRVRSQAQKQAWGFLSDKAIVHSPVFDAGRSVEIEEGIALCSPSATPRQRRAPLRRNKRGLLRGEHPHWVRESDPSESRGFFAIFGFR